MSMNPRDSKKLHNEWKEAMYDQERARKSRDSSFQISTRENEKLSGSCEYSPVCEIIPEDNPMHSQSLQSSICLNVLELVHYTKDEDIHAGALLLKLFSQDTGLVTETWIPKTLCKNLKLIGDDKFVYVWEDFVNDKQLEDYIREEE